MQQPIHLQSVLRFASFTFLLAWLAQVITHRYLLADGVNFLLEILSSQGFHQWDVPRHYHHLLTQWPVVAAIWLGVNKLALLSYLYGASLFAVPLLTIWGCIWVTPQSQRIYVVLPMIAMAHSSLHGYLFIISESHLAAGLYWFLLFFLLFAVPNRPSVLQMLVVAGLSVAMLRIYEFFLLLGPLLSACAAWQLYAANKGIPLAKPGSRPLNWLLALIMLCGMDSAAIAFQYMFFSDRSVAQAGLGHIVGDLLQDPTCWISGALLLWFVSTWLWPKTSLQPIWLLLAAATGCLLSLLTYLGPPWLPTPELHYSGRLFNLLIPLALTGALWRSQHQETQLLGKTHWLVPLLVLLVWNASWQVVLSGRWQRYTNALQVTLAERTGLVPVDSISLPDNHFGFSWAMPGMSIVYSALAQQPVRTLLVPPPGPFAPFAPQDPNTWPNLTPYGVVYDIPAILGQAGSPRVISQ